MKQLTEQWWQKCLNDKDKLQFFELAYANVYDPENYATLERFLNDEEEINKFRSLLKNQ